jgi:four helix bundle protein
MQNHNFENLEVWRRGVQMAIKVCVASHGSRDFATRDQMVRAAISVPANIAEGAERSSDADFSRYLEYAKGSCGELRTQLVVHQGVCARLGIEPFDGTDAIIGESRDLARMLSSLIDRVRNLS